MKQLCHNKQTGTAICPLTWFKISSLSLIPSLRSYINIIIYITHKYLLSQRNDGKTKKISYVPSPPAHSFLV